MPSFDTVSEANMEEVKNAVTQSNKVITNRFDMKGTSAKIELKDKEREVVIFGDTEFHLDQIITELTQTMGKRKVDVRFLDFGKVEKIGGDKVSVFTATTALQDPHRIEARPSLLAKARRAQLVVATGADLEVGGEALQGRCDVGQRGAERCGSGVCGGLHRCQG